MKKLWGDNYYDPQLRQFTTEPQTADGKPLERTFVEFILKPIMKLFKSIMEDKREVVFKIVSDLGITLTNDEKEMKGKQLLKAVFMKWLNAAEALLEMIVEKLPSPVQA